MTTLVIVAVILLFVFNCLLSKAVPSIAPQEFVSDEEFCRLMPDVPENTALKVREILVDATGWERDEIHPHTKLVEFEY